MTAKFYNLGKFQALDYGHDIDDSENLKRYGSLEPPVYDLSKVLTRVSLWYSVADQLVSYKVNEHF